MPDNQGTLIVTGASRGIGAAIATLASARGFALAVNLILVRTAAAGESLADFENIFLQS